MCTPTETKSCSDCLDKDLREVQDDRIEVKEVMTSPDDCEIALIHNRIRFILVMVLPTDPTKDDIVAEWLRKIEESEMDPDEVAYDECLGDLRESAISVCKDTIYTLSSSVPVSAKERQSLEDFLHPITFWLQLFSEQGAFQVRRIDDKTKHVNTFKPVTLPREFLVQKTSTLTPAPDIDVIEDLHMGQVLKVSKMGEVCVLKRAYNGSEDQLTREIQILQQISEQWEPGHPARPAVPQLLGLVGSHGQVIGILEDFIDGDKLSDLDINEISAAQRQEWNRQIEQTMTLLHQHRFIWGDVKAENVLVDKDKRPWLIDFGGSRTEGWVEKHLSETIEGDLQGLRRLAEYLDLR